ncbi:alanine or glycine:cation symporter, AGCS family [Anaerosphaera aminiphila DSM 21120]|uniref:Alanine or glycine:cation symporter, AGCS family n=1 Tax=Anaerosphaera aminiphila DSM 21120 TaxID=1120995 RepID=A0A1M5TTK2_9FIRM|nr:alanine/glycine:cation symporter family protein [Anaerosphaera aminiphila]SHH54054.1 alanine or glycine:cation symporter, AGCS family [Anaerosphaera aminiphila DSM 21120]
METFKAITSFLNDFIYTYYLIPILLMLGLWYTIKLKGGQFTHIGHAVKLITQPAEKQADGKKGLSPFKAFTISAASHIGTGNIVGVAAAIAIGGPGAVFWMWITALIGGASSFVENTLGQIFKEKNEDGTFKGGPAYYMTKALGLPKLGIIFSVIVAVVYGFMFNAMQANTIAAAFSGSFNIDVRIVGVVLIAIVAVIIFGGVRRIADVTSLLVPVMAVAYMALAIFIIIKNIALVPHMFGIIFKSAFGIQAVVGGGVGAAILNGVRRGLFSNEAGMGAVPNASATADVSHPAKQGLIQALGVYLDTILVCSATAFIIILAGEGVYADPSLEGLAITQNALSAEVGNWAQMFLTVCIFMFAFSSVIGNYYYGENNIAHLGFGKSAINVYRVLVLVMVFLGCVGDFSVVWNTGDVFMGIMALINLVVLFALGKIAVETYYDYFSQLKEGKEPVFKVSNIESLKGLEDEIECWDK